MASNLIGNLAVNLTMNTTAFQNGAKAAEKRADTLKAKMSGIGASIKGIGGALAVGVGAGAIAGLGAIANSAFELGSSLTEAAAKVGVTVEALQEMRFAATQNGVSVETMDGALNKMTKTLGELQLGNETTAKTFGVLGLAARDFIGLSPTESFAKIADALNKIEDPTIRAAAATKIYGRSYAELNPLIALGADGIAAAAAEKRKDGVISTEQAAILDNLADGWDKLKDKVGVATAQFIANQAGSADASKGLENMGESIGKLIIDFGKLLGWLDRATLKFHEFQRLLATRIRDSALTSWIPGAAAESQRQINILDAEIQRRTSAPSTGRVRGSGRVVRPRIGAGTGGALSGAMSGLNSIDFDTVLDKAEKRAANTSNTIAKPIKQTTTKVKDAFKELADEVQPLLDRLFPEVKALVDYKADQNNLSAWAKAGKISADQLRESLIRLRDSYYGADGPVAVTQDGGFVEDIVDSLPSLEDATNKMAGRLAATNVVIEESFADMATNVVDSLSGLANSIKSGGIVGILSGVLDLAISLGKIGAFGGGLQTRLNSPPGRARGGPVNSNRTYMVGENGPELFTSNSGGYITPNKDLQGSRGSMVVKVLPSDYFDVVVDKRAADVAAPMAMRGGLAGASLAESRLATRQRNRIP